MATILEKYAALLIQREAIDAILKDIRKPAKKELRACKDEQAVALSVSFHITNKPVRVYFGKFAVVLKKLKEQMDSVKKRAEKAGEMKKQNKYTFDAEIPKGIKKDLFETVPEYVAHFGLRKS